jgi:hypothetical protein
LDYLSEPKVFTGALTMIKRKDPNKEGIATLNWQSLMLKMERTHEPKNVFGNERYKNGFFL